MQRNKWQLHRAGLLNFWYYDEEIFDFSGGKLLLRGSNGSGKSVTMQSLLPVLLDGRKSPDRLDPFGSRARRMEDYLLGEKEVVDREERTGYLFLEYKREDTEQYLTTGIGLRAKRHSQMGFWGFAILDNRRVGKDFFLYKMEPDGAGGKEKIPLTRRELENRLAEGGRVVRSQKEYMALVNQHLFGFESLEAYEDLIKLLIQLRSPKLSKDFKPTVVYEILNAALPALSDDDLRSLSDTIEHLDQTKHQLDQLLREQQSLARLCQHYDRYNRFVLAEKADGFVKAQRRLARVEREKRETGERLATLKAELEADVERQAELERQQEALEEEQRMLEKHEVFDAERERQEASEARRRAADEAKRKRRGFEAKQAKERKLTDEVRSTEDRMAELEAEVAERLAELGDAAEAAAFAGHELNAADFERQGEAAIAVWKQEGDRFLDELAELVEKWRTYERVKRRYDEEFRLYGEAQRVLDDARVEERKAAELFREEKDRLLDEIHRWLDASEHLTMPAEDVRLVSQRITDLYEPNRFEDVREPVTAAFHRFLEENSEEKVERQQALKEVRRQLAEKEEEWREWRDRMDPEPERRPDTEQARALLREQHVPFVPFYAAVEFREGVTEEERERLEAAISEMGLLDALIVPEAFRKSVGDHDKVLKANPHTLAHTLADLLQPSLDEDAGVSAADVDAVLRSVLISDAADEGMTALREDGRFQIGLLHGHAPETEYGRSVFIGKAARRRFRKQQMERIEAELAQLREEAEDLEAALAQLAEREREARQEYEAMPGETDAAEAHRMVREAQQAVAGAVKEAEQLNEKVKRVLAEREALKRELAEAMRELEVERTEAAIVEAHEEMKRYMNRLRDLELVVTRLGHQRESLNQQKSRLQEVMEDVDALKGETNEWDDRVQRLALKLAKIEQHLQALGAEDVRRKMREVHESLKTVKEELPVVINRLGGIQAKIEEQTARVAGKEDEVQAGRQWVSLWETVFRDEAALALVELPGNEEDDVYRQANKVVQTFADEDRKTDRRAIENRLTNAFYQEQSVLIEYRMSQETVLAIETLPEGVEEEKAEEIRGKAKRTRLLLEYNGQRVNPMVVKRRIEEDIDVQKTVLEERDRELFEEIILNNVGAKIRAKISRAERWVAEINRLMAARDDSSGLDFSIRWKPRTADYDDELDTKDLVDLLRSKAGWLKKEDTNRLTQHFRSKIERAKEVLELDGYGESLHDIIKQMLDYRQWFDFTLYYQREGEKKREMTNNAFYRFSGGEKAMAMYIPLFSAAYSRYLDARDDAPYIISLDEAFAGVDERNIRDMFRLVEQLGLNFIMNSQALWGDYDTVSELSICELVRPKNAPFVTVVRYHWDGRVKRLMTAPAQQQVSASREG